MDKETLMLIGIALALVFFAWLDRRDGKKNTTVAPKKGAESDDSYMIERMGAGYVGIFDNDDE